MAQPDVISFKLHEVDASMLAAAVEYGVRLHDDGLRDDDLRAGLKFALRRCGVFFPPDDQITTGLLLAALYELVEAHNRAELWAGEVEHAADALKENRLNDAAGWLKGLPDRMRQGES